MRTVYFGCMLCAAIAACGPSANVQDDGALTGEDAATLDSGIFDGNTAPDGAIDPDGGSECAEPPLASELVIHTQDGQDFSTTAPYVVLSGTVPADIAGAPVERGET